MTVEEKGHRWTGWKNDGDQCGLQQTGRMWAIYEIMQTPSLAGPSSLGVNENHSRFYNLNRTLTYLIGRQKLTLQD
jgi:hypothetical protein